MRILPEFPQKSLIDQQNYEPVFFNLSNSDEREKLDRLLRENTHIQIHDELKSQLLELIKIRNPTQKLSAEQYEAAYAELIGDAPEAAYGLWVYYPWSSRLVHIVNRDEYIELRTSRNMYKITPEERSTLSSRKIGVVGLSVGQSIALTIAMERICGELRLADFDSLELTNMNRIRAGVHNLGIPKVIIAAREIAEIDPFIRVKIFKDGLTEENIDAFFCDPEPLDILVEECDGLDMKIMSRVKARQYRIPVVMDTNDRGMLDIERFDLEPERELLHGLIPAGITDLKSLRDLSNQEKVPLLGAMVGIESISGRMKMSLGEMGKTITTWPQLASSVVLGGAMVTDTCRRILLQEITLSGRFYIDFDELIKD
jgi:hypothetical protein